MKLTIGVMGSSGGRLDEDAMSGSKHLIEVERAPPSARARTSKKK
jgi:hypothetical protein